MLQLRPAERKQTKMKLALSGPSGSGKTYSALLLAHGMVENWRKIAIIDTENGSGDLYAHLGDYNVVPLKDHSPESYIHAISICVNAGQEVVIIDSLSHEWNWCKQYHDSLTGNSFTNWAKITPRHNA